MTKGLDHLMQPLRMAVLAEVRLDQPDLSMRQLGVLLAVYQTDEPQTVRGLAETLNIGRPVVSRSLDRLSKSDLAQRTIDPADRRSVFVMRTNRGRAMMRRLAEAMVSAANDR